MHKNDMKKWKESIKTNNSYDLNYNWLRTNQEHLLTKEQKVNIVIQYLLVERIVIVCQ